MWRLLVVGVGLVVVTGCGAHPSDPVTTTGAVPTSAKSTVTAPMPATTAAAATSIATAAVEPTFVVIAPGDGFYTDAQPVTGVHGDVRPEAVVTVDGVQADVSYVGDTAFGDRMWRWHPRDGITLVAGANRVAFEATFADGSTLRETRTYHYDPGLQRSTGYLVELTLAIPPRVTVELATLEYGELGLVQTSEDTEITEIPIADDAVFVVLGGPEVPVGRVLDLEEFTQLAVTAARGEPLQDLWWDTIFPTTLRDFWLEAAPWEFLVTPDGTLQQAAQLYSP